MVRKVKKKKKKKEKAGWPRRTVNVTWLREEHSWRIFLCTIFIDTIFSGDDQSLTTKSVSLSVPDSDRGSDQFLCEERGRSGEDHSDRWLLLFQPSPPEDRTFSGSVIVLKVTIFLALTKSQAASNRWTQSPRHDITHWFVWLVFAIVHCWWLTVINSNVTFSCLYYFDCTGVLKSSSCLTSTLRGHTTTNSETLITHRQSWYFTVDMKPPNLSLTPF